MKFKWIVILLVLSFINSQLIGQETNIIMSPIGPQYTYAGARLEVFSSSLKYFDDLQFEILDKPSFAQLINDGKGKARLIFDPEIQDTGKYNIRLKTHNSIGESYQSFVLEVLNIPIESTVYYIDPINGSSSNSGTKSDPFRTLSEVLSQLGSDIPDGSFMFLSTGYHGVPIFSKHHDSPIHVLAASGQTPTVERINFSFTNNWIVSGLKISPESAGILEKRSYVNIFAQCEDITVSNCEIYSIKDSESWTKEDWHQHCGDGISSLGEHCQFINNYIYNTWFPVQLRADNNDFNYNIIDRFGADAIRGLKNNQNILYNQVTNATVDDYDAGQHDDGFQSWTFNEPVKNMVIKGNQIADLTDPNLPLKAKIMQGIVCFDGFTEDWVIEDNLVITHHSHGISLYGANNCKIVNNTIVKNPYKLFLPSHNPWIRINKHKDGRLSNANLTRNNIMTSSFQDEYPGTFDHNYVGSSYGLIFQDYNNWDFHLKDSDKVIDMGKKEDASTYDADSKIREDEMVIDLGCYEREATAVINSKPLATAAVYIDSIGPTTAKLSWIPVDNALYYLVKRGDITYTTSKNSLWLSGLSPASGYEISVQTVNYAGQESREYILLINTSDFSTIDSLFVYAHTSDIEVNISKKLEWKYAPYYTIGNIENMKNRVGVITFKIPDIPNDYEIESIRLALNLKEVYGNPTANIDLFGLGYYQSSEVQKNMYWQGDIGDEGAIGIGLGDNVFTSNSILGENTIADFSSDIIDYYNGLLSNGAKPGDYLFFRLNKDIVDIEQSYYRISSASENNSALRPKLIFKIKNTTATKEISYQRLKVYPSVVLSDQSFRIDIPDNASISNLFIFDMQGNKIWSQLINHEEMIELNADILPNTGMYMIQLISNDKIWHSKLLKVEIR